MRVNARESRQVTRARRKLQEQMAKESTALNPTALAAARQLMQKWIVRHQPERIDLKETHEISIFDENRHPAKVSKFVNHLMKQLETNVESSEKGPLSPRRVTPQTSQGPVAQQPGEEFPEQG